MINRINEISVLIVLQKSLQKLVLVTDGQPAVPEGYLNPYEATLSAAESAKRNGIEIITIGTENADSDFLDRLATKKDLSIIVNTINLSRGIESASNLLMICDK